MGRNENGIGDGCAMRSTKRMAGFILVIMFLCFVFGVYSCEKALAQTTGSTTAEEAVQDMPIFGGKMCIRDSDNGIIHEGDLTNSQPSKWTMKDVFDIKGSVGPSYILDCAYIDRNKWIFINTGDYETLMKDVNVTDYMIAANISSGASSINDLAKLTSDAGSVSTDVKGWYMEIPEDEYVTSPPVYYNGHIFFSSYIKSEDICSVGTSRIYVLNATTGKGAWTGGAKYVELAGVKVSGLSLIHI